MQITIRPTDRLVEIGDVIARVWDGETESGVAVLVYVSAIAIDANKVNESEVADLIELTGALTCHLTTAGDIGLAEETTFKS
jgi:hypothetical protein